MLPSSEVIYRYEWCHPRGVASLKGHKRPTHEAATLIIPSLKRTQYPWARSLGFGLIAFALGGVVGPLSTSFRLEAKYANLQEKYANAIQTASVKLLPPSFQILYNPLVTPDGASIDPVNREFSLVVPKIGLNAAVVATVDPTKTKDYDAALKKGVAHSSTSVFPDQDGTVFLFSHSTNYEWFVKDLNAVFYLLKNLEKGDVIVIFYKDKEYTYRLTEKKVVKASDVTYLYPVLGKKQLILQTCWPPGSTAERLLIFADLVEEGNSI